MNSFKTSALYPVTSISQTFHFWVAIFHLRPPMVFLSLSLYGMPGLAHLMNVLFWGWCDSHISFLRRDMSGKLWNRLSVSVMVDIGFLSNIMKYPSPKCYIVAVVAEWLSSWHAEQEDRGSIPGLAIWSFRDWLSPASKSRYGWNTAEAT